MQSSQLSCNDVCRPHHCKAGCSQGAQSFLSQSVESRHVFYKLSQFTDWMLNLYKKWTDAKAQIDQSFVITCFRIRCCHCVEFAVHILPRLAYMLTRRRGRVGHACPTARSTRAACRFFHVI